MTQKPADKEPPRDGHPYPRIIGILRDIANFEALSKNAREQLILDTSTIVEVWYENEDLAQLRVLLGLMSVDPKVNLGRRRKSKAVAREIEIALAYHESGDKQEIAEVYFTSTRNVERYHARWKDVAAKILAAYVDRGAGRK